MKKAVTFLREMLAIGKQSIVTLDRRSASFGKKIKIRSKKIVQSRARSLNQFLGKSKDIELRDKLARIYMQDCT